MSDEQALRIRLEGALEAVEAAIAELERVTARLHEGHTGGVQHALGLRQDDALRSARAKVAKLAPQEPSLAAVLKRLGDARAALETEVHAQADERGFARGTVEERARLLEVEQVLFRGSTFPRWMFALLPVGVAWLALLATSRGLHGVERWRPMMVVVVVWLVAFLGQWLFAPRVLVTTASVRVGRELIHPDRVARVEVETRRGRRGGRSFRVTVVEKTGVRLRPVSMPSVPLGFTRALGLLGIRVVWDDVSRG